MALAPPPDDWTDTSLNATAGNHGGIRAYTYTYLYIYLYTYLYTLHLLYTYLYTASVTGGFATAAAATPTTRHYTRRAARWAGWTGYKRIARWCYIGLHAG
ncbi:hypothetical protein HO173_003247 [Letharia columbiana]|uniref:Uncharacterized protein n=1 Tax=Letharia columbiana TaxID=112416 RepID=A0A8H6G1M3_9LECA|nr:uncharacterized protein HO173_003247 [Letharia columbiana]KAF6238741.1 hypothetical protein HO173_003247 [Letharia columbiana]